MYWQASPLSDLQQRGRQIYLTGTSPSGRLITALLGSGETKVSAAALACATCHGQSGLGASEGGVSPSNLTWESLTRPYEVAAPSGRKHGPYTEVSLRRAVTMGLDPAGNKLQAAMPRFRMSREDAEALIAYIKILGHTLDPGLTDTAIRVATFIPPDGPLADTGITVSRALQAYLSDLNERGGVYGRKLELHTAATVATTGVKTLIQDEDIFAVLSPVIAGSEKELLPLFEKDQVPLIGPFTNLPQPGMPIDRHIFYLYAGLDDQARALCHFAAKNLNPSALGIVTPDQGLAAGLDTAIRQRCAALKLNIVADIALAGDHFDPDRIATQLRDAGVYTVLFLGSSEQTVDLAGAAARIAWHPNILLIGSLAGLRIFDIPTAFQGKAFVSYPTLPSDWSPVRLRFFAGIAEKYQLSAEHMASQIAALSAAEIFVEGLKRSGRELSREKLVDNLEGLYRYNTGLTPGITYGPNRRVGALGAYVVLANPITKQLEPAGGWIPLD
jgi:ABC-type branched-subunit amino acid transport system substrate-binding protein